ncbi:MAG: hypothetical protein ACXV4A_11010 [Actinomycetes bacterium]
MTDTPDDQPFDEPYDEHRRANGDRKLDEDAAWRDIVEHYGERPTADPAPVEPAPETPPRFAVFERRLEDPGEDEATWDDEGHFVPPEPPPLPQLEPRRKLAWIALFGAPLLLLIVVLVGATLPTWLLGLMVAAFIGGFVYLVATMSRNRPDDWSGDDGAVV